MAVALPKTIDLAALRAQYVKDSLDITFIPARIVVHGPSGTGKTILACTASKFWGTSTEFLSDIVVIDVDGSAADSLLNFGKRCHIVDYGAIRRNVDDPREAMRTAIDIAASIPGVEIIIPDTVSVWTKDLEVWLGKNTKEWVSDGKADTRKFWTLQASANSDVAYQLRNTGLSFVATFHSRANFADLAKDGDTKERSARQQLAQSLPGEPTITLDAIGSARDLWPKLVSLVLACRVTIDPKGKEIRRVYTRVEEDMQAKSRFNKFLSPSEEPDLGAMIAKVRSAISAQQQKKEG